MTSSFVLSTVLLALGAVVAAWSAVRAWVGLRALSIGAPTAEGVVDDGEGDAVRVTVQQRRSSGNGVERFFDWVEVDRVVVRRIFSIRVGDGERLTVEPTARSRVILRFGSTDGGRRHRARIARLASGDRVVLFCGKRRGGRVSDASGEPLVLVDPALVERLRLVQRLRMVLPALALLFAVALGAALWTTLPIGSSPPGSMPMPIAVAFAVTTVALAAFPWAVTLSTGVTSAARPLRERDGSRLAT